METGILLSSSIFIAFLVSNARANHYYCPPSSCGNIRNISYPFRLKTDRPNCGNLRYNLSCENNNTTTVLYLHSAKYHVQSINYNNYTIRLVDSNVRPGNCSIPRYSLSPYNFSIDLYSSYSTQINIQNGNHYEIYVLSRPITFVNCENPVKSPLYISTAPCNISRAAFWSSSELSGPKGHSYVLVGSTYVELKDSCRIEQMAMMPWLEGTDDRNISYEEIHNQLAYGFELSWMQCYAEMEFNFAYDCYVDESNKVQCGPHCPKGSRQKICKHGFWTRITFKVEDFLKLKLRPSVFWWTIAKLILGIPCVIAFFIYKWQKRHSSMYDIIEEFLKANNNLMPIRYSYSEIRKMTKRFKDKLGEGGYGSVYKGKLRSGHFVAIKILGKAKANGQEFINEVATIGRIHHVNVVRLVGFCVEGSKRALVYEFMPNGGIEYLHRGCNMQILHFDIKPHNILLDENYNPKVSDFGLAKLCPLETSIVSLTAVRGTMGYIAPELFYKNIGGVSSKADFYSFGMLLMEMASRRKNLNAAAEQTSQIYFPSWVYDQINEGKDLQMEDATEEKSKIKKKMMIVALWCIQMKPNDRPSMNKVREMLEGEVEFLEMPPKPFLCPQQKPMDDDGEIKSN
ncbi:hypothetical protein FNV43_RR24628 [Rhamnella rubrinervis]|uniref:Protein kinase domain-containing protein n=1 Tax=Rhamnella rubrinervis TaxID=2594499 RepID=A0A8K0GQE7_9ROSA|nr:hypothetical protein FNV43_RR24628 [Rhamnella rubrinervis]